MKQRSNALHFWPRQVSERASSLCQSALVSGSDASSARSPVCVVFSQAAMARYCSISSRPSARADRSGRRVFCGRDNCCGPSCSRRSACLRRWDKRLLQKRNVFVEELLLQLLGSGRDDDALAGANHRQQIRQCLAGPRAGFDDQVPLLSRACSTAWAICSCPRRNSYAGWVFASTPPGARTCREKRRACVRQNCRKPRAGRKEARSLYNSCTDHVGAAGRGVSCRASSGAA